MQTRAWVGSALDPTALVDHGYSPTAGGAWTIGYKAWGALLARRLSRHGVVVACLDYRNFPQVRERA